MTEASAPHALRRVAVIGAGIAGLAAARALKAAGVAVAVIDKSRGLGGRMATRRADGLQFDHGAQHFTARGPRFRAVIEALAAEGAAAEWFDGRWVGTPGMSAPARALARGLAVVPACTVTALRRGAEGWRVEAAEGPPPPPADGGFDAVILAVPAPQAAPLAASAGVAFHELDHVRYAPCWALMAAFDAPVAALPDRLRQETSDLAWVARDGAKPGRRGETIVAHASPDWSRRNLEMTLEEAGRALLAALDALAGGGLPAPRFLAAHRWRHALVERSAGAPCLWDAAARIGACGDWALGPRVEAAFDSGEALAEAVLRG